MGGGTQNAPSPFSLGPALQAWVRQQGHCQSQHSLTFGSTSHHCLAEVSRAGLRHQPVTPTPRPDGPTGRGGWGWGVLSLKGWPTCLLGYLGVGKVVAVVGVLLRARVTRGPRCPRMFAGGSSRPPGALEAEGRLGLHPMVEGSGELGTHSGDPGQGCLGGKLRGRWMRGLSPGASLIRVELERLLQASLILILHWFHGLGRLCSLALAFAAPLETLLLGFSAQVLGLLLASLGSHSWPPVAV